MLLELRKYFLTLFLFFFYAATFAEESNLPVYVLQNDSKIKAILFDTFGTVVDWRGTMVGEFHTFFQQKKIKHIDVEQFVESWVNAYAEDMGQISEGKKPFLTVDELNKKSLDKTLKHYSIFNDFSEKQRENMWLVWHRLKPWPDSVSGFNSLYASLDCY